MRCLFVILLLAASALGAAEVIGTNSFVTYTDRSLSNDVVALRPGNGETVMLNPPRFTWPYDPAGYIGAYTSYRFQFQIGYTTNFTAATNNVLDLDTPYNFYNAVDHFTNATVYWRVGYRNVNTKTTTNWIAPRSFTIATNAVVWDRAKYAGDDVYATNLTHPCVGFRATNRTAIGTWYQATNASGFSALQTAVGNITNRMWWTNAVDRQTNNADESYNAVVFAELSQAAFYWMLTSNLSIVADGNAASAFEWATTNYAARWIAQDAFFQRGNLQSIGMCYDWFYSEMNTAQRSNTMWAITNILGGYYARYPSYGGAQIVFDGSPEAGWYYGYVSGMTRTMHSHSISGLNAIMPMALAVGGDDTGIGREFLRAAVHYYAGVGSGFGDEEGMDGGRGYNDYNLGIDAYGIYDALACLTYSLGPDWTNQPAVNGLTEWAMRYKPVEIKLNGNDPWGDGGTIPPNIRADYFWNSHAGSIAARLSGRADAAQHASLSYSAYQYGGASPGTGQYFETGFFYSYPTNSAHSNLVGKFKLHQYGGSVIGSTLPPNTFASFTNGIGFVFQSRLKSSGVGHTMPADGHIEIWAYGARVTAGGGAYGESVEWNKSGVSKNTVLIDGIGNGIDGMDANYFPHVDIHGKFTRYLEGSNYLYAAADLTGHRKVNQRPEITKYDYLNNYTRHMLFMRDKYFVIYDSLVTTNAATFAQGWHIQENTVSNLTVNGFDYTSSNLVSGTRPWVKTYVAQMVTDGVGVLQFNSSGSANRGDGTGYTNYVAQNPITRRLYGNGLSADGPVFRASAIWFTNSAAATNWNFMTVLYPIRDGESAPTITRIDNFTVAVTNGADGDVISFNTNSAVATLIVDAGATNEPPSSPQVAFPVFSPAGPTVAVLPTNITITCSTPGATILWWTNSGPTNTYSTPVDVNYGVTLYSYATNTGYINSAIISALYVTNSPPVAAGRLRVTTMRVGTVGRRVAPAPDPTACDSVNDASLVAYWKLDAASGNESDAKGTNTLTAANTPGAGTGLVSGSRIFSAADMEYFSAASGPNLAVGDVDFTFWVWARVTNNGAIQSIIEHNSEAYYLRYIGSIGNLQFGTKGLGYHEVNRTLTTNTWHLIMCEWNSDIDRMTLYIDNDSGAYVDPTNDPPVEDQAAVYIGAFAGILYPLNGELDEIGFTKRLLSSAERNAIYNAGAACRPGGL